MVQRESGLSSSRRFSQGRLVLESDYNQSRIHNFAFPTHASHHSIRPQTEGLVALRRGGSFAWNLVLGASILTLLAPQNTHVSSSRFAFRRISCISLLESPSSVADTLDDGGLSGFWREKSIVRRFI